MKKFDKINHEIDSLLTLKPRVFEDHRGQFIETYQKRDFHQLGIVDDFVQDNSAYSTFGVLRGLHFQHSGAEQSKLLRCVVGEIFDVAIDLREDSPTKGQWIGEILSEKNQKIFYIPPGFAHGFLTLSEHSLVTYKLSNYYNSELEDAIHPMDPSLDIKWDKHIDVSQIILSTKDKNAKSYLDYLKGYYEN
ncbi:MAG: dTDP-4-dehydrorhamnose 3,5-epimerase [Candidatus Cloacimonetes bacterium]|nr:dTDP-4-dehydrorhamnose 3,5-epimerase [Candidatus Cloacimonadota bacterium]